MIYTYKGKERADGTFRLYFRFYKGKTKRDIPTNIFIPVKDWQHGNPIGKVLSSNPKHDKINREIAKLYAQYTKDESPDDIKFGFLKEEYLQGYAAGGSRDNYTWWFESFVKYAGDINLSTITLKLLKEYEDFLRNKKNQRNEYLTSDGIESYFKPISGIFKLAISKGLYPIDKNPMVYFKIDRKRAKGKAEQKSVLTPQEIECIRAAQLSGWQHESRLIYLFQYIMGGVRISDMCLLRKSNIDKEYLKYKMHKLRNYDKDEHVIKLNKEAMEILEYFNYSGKYPTDLLFPLLRPEQFKTEDILDKAIGNATRRVNDALKLIGNKLNIEKNITTHTARHSIKDHLDSSIDNQRTISDTLGHEKIDTTQGYAKRRKQERVDEALEKVRG